MNWKIIKVITTYYKLKRWITLKLSRPIEQYRQAFGIDIYKARW